MCLVIFLVRVLSILKKLLHTIREKIKKEPCQLDKKQKSYSKSKNVKKMPKILKTFSLKIYIKVLEFKKIPKTSLNKDTKDKKNYMKDLNSKNKNTKGGRSP